MTTPSLDELLEKLVSSGATDLHLKVGSPPAYRINGEVHTAELAPLTAEQTEALLRPQLPDHISMPSPGNDVDFAWGTKELGRFKVSAYTQRGSISVVIRRVPSESMTLAELGLPSTVTKLCDERSGLIVISGPAGSGKRTTCAAIIDHINTNRRANIITLEDPIGVLHKDKRSIISQREVGVDIESLGAGIASAVRQDPDVIYLGELKDRETIEGALTAAENGHLVLSTMYTSDACETVYRMLDSFPAYLERRVRQMLTSSLTAIVSQRLLPSNDGQGLTAAVEILLNTEGVSERLSGEKDIETLYEAVAEGGFFGMQTLDQAMVAKYEAGEVSFSDALLHVVSPREFKLATGEIAAAV
jgi:twitching motility protein PilT